MSDLKRKYDGLKQAHKELSVEVVELRGDIKTSNELLKMADKFVGIVVAERNNLKDAMGEVVSGYKAFNDDSDNYEQLTIAVIKGKALLDGKKPDLSVFEMLDKMEPIDVLDLLKENMELGTAAIKEADNG